MVVGQGEIWWADLGEPHGSEAGFRRPVLVVQCDAFNQSGLNTVVCVPLTTAQKWAKVPGNALLRARDTGLPQISVANVSQILAVDKRQLEERVGKIPRQQLTLVFAGLDIILGR